MLDIQELCRSVYNTGNFKLALVGVFTSQKSATSTHQSFFCFFFFFFGELVDQLTTGWNPLGAGTS